MLERYSRVHAAIDLDAVLHNIQEMQHIIKKDTQIVAVVKADGYGHGALPVCRELEQLPCVWGYGVATAEEGLILRKHKLEKPILALGAVFPQQYRQMAEQDIRPAVYSLSMARGMSEAMEETGGSLKVHIKIDTGMSRLGFQATEESAAEIAQIAAMPHIMIEGLFTHFATADETDKTMSSGQLRAFHKMKMWLKNRDVCPELVHCSNSAGIIDLPGANMGLVRAGIAMYGLWPSDEVQKERLSLRPAMSLISQVVFLKELEAGRSISYGAACRLERDSKVATIPIGYGDGYPRSLSGKGYVLIRGEKAPILGRICMDQFMVDVTHIEEVCEGDEAVLLGQSGERRITMEELGDLSGRFNYEFACNIGKRIPRVYYKDKKIVDTIDCFEELG